MSRLGLLGAAAAVAVALVAAAIAISQSGTDDDEPAPPPRVERIAQNGISPGDPEARAALIEFADLQCPFCAEFANDQLPG